MGSSNRVAAIWVGYPQTVRVLAVVVVLGFGGQAHARPPDKKPRPQPAPGPAITESSARLLEKVKELYRSLEYEKVIPVAEQLLERDDLAVDQRLDAYRYYGSAKAIVEDPIEAERPFRMLLRSRPDYDLPPDTPPKILNVFRRVQTEEKALASQLREVERARIVSQLKLIGDLPTQGRGGRALALSLRLRDPTGSVDAVLVPYRREGQASFSSLALQRDDAGDWRGAIPAEFTADEAGFTLEYFIQTLDAVGPLLEEGTAREPRRIAISAGAIDRARPPVPRWAFFTGVGLTAVAGLGAGGSGYALSQTQANYRLKAGAADRDGALLALRARQGDQLATATNAALISAGVALLATLAMAPFVNWSNEP